jgi:diguanylate cyclase (GGDEF)-like protein/PAS domain S-box-containing protein
MGNTLEPAVGVWLLTRFGFHKVIETLKDYYLLLIIAAVGGTLFSALFGSTVTLVTGYVAMEDLPSSFFRWWIGNMLGTLLAVPILVWHNVFDYQPSRRPYETAPLVALTLLFCAVVFLDVWPGIIGYTARAYWGFPLIIWAAVRFGTQGVSIILLIIHALSLWGVVRGTGYFGADMAQTGLFNFWLYHLIINITGMTLAITLNEGRVSALNLERERGRLRESENRLRQYLEFSPIPLGVSELQSQRIVFLNHAFSELFGYSQEELPDLGTWFERAYPDPSYRQHMVPRWLNLVEDSRHKGASTPSHEVQIACKDGSERSVEIVAAPSGDHLLVAFNDVTQKRQAKELIWRQAHYDALTELPNRRLFLDRLREGIKSSQRNGQGLALLLVDLDRFKEVNDTFGHEVGDQLLINAARRLASCVTAEGTVARLGGDEFIIILPGLHNPDQASQVAGAIIRALSGPFQLGQEQVFVSASIGVTYCPDDGTDSKTLLRNADQALLQTKNLGRNNFFLFTPALKEAGQIRLSIIRELRGALSSGQMQVHYQPIIDLKSGTFAKAEALVRWPHPTRGLISPAEFIAVAEDIGLIGEIGDWVFRQAAQQAQRCHQLGFPVQISVNKSVRQFLTGHSHEAWPAYLEQIGLPPGSITIEITENLLLDDRPELLGKLNQFRAAGIEVSIDDFGTGYSSLSYLKKFDVDYLKIDRAFVRDLTTDPSDLALAEAIIVMAHKLGLKVIAEGVETKAQQEILAASSCDYAQGYLYAEALPSERFEDFLVNWKSDIRNGYAPAHYH